MLDRGANVVTTTRNEIGNHRESSHVLKVVALPFLCFSSSFVFAFFPPGFCFVFLFLRGISPVAQRGGCRRWWLPSWPLFVACCLEGVASGSSSVRAGQTLSGWIWRCFFVWKHQVNCLFSYVRSHGALAWDYACSESGIGLSRVAAYLKPPF